MLTFELTPGTFVAIKDTLRVLLPDAGSARRVEAAARGLGFNTHAALRASLSTGPATVTADPKAFSGFLTEAKPYAGEVFLGACAVQAILATLRRFPHIPMDDLLPHLGADARAWSQPGAQMVAYGFLCVLDRLRDPTFLRGLGSRVNADQIQLPWRNATPRPHDVSMAAAAALHAGFRPLEDQPEHGTPAFHVPPPVSGSERARPDRHKELSFLFLCSDELFGSQIRYGHGTLAEASRYAELLRAAPKGTCISHRTLSRAEWDAVRRDGRTFVFDLCSEIAELEGRPYPGRPWSEERAKVRDAYLLDLSVRPLRGAATAGPV